MVSLRSVGRSGSGRDGGAGLDDLLEQRLPAPPPVEGLVVHLDDLEKEPADNVVALGLSGQTKVIPIESAAGEAARYLAALKETKLRCERIHAFLDKIDDSALTDDEGKNLGAAKLLLDNVRRALDEARGIKP